MIMDHSSKSSSDNYLKRGGDTHFCILIRFVGVFKFVRLDGLRNKRRWFITRLHRL